MRSTDGWHAHVLGGMPPGAHQPNRKNHTTSHDLHKLASLRRISTTIRIRRHPGSGDKSARSRRLPATWSM